MKSQQDGSENSRASAHDRAGSQGRGFPAAQLYREEPWRDRDSRVSDDNNMVVRANDGKCLFAKNGVPVANNVIVPLMDVGKGFAAYVDNAAFVNDCRQYAVNNWKAIHNFVEGSHVGKIDLLNVQGGQQESRDYITDFNNLLEQGEALPGVGEAYYAVNNPADPGINDLSHYNMHWAVVVAQSGNDVVTAESEPTAGSMWFQMYSQSDQQQSFKSHYMGRDKFHQLAKFFRARFRREDKPPTEVIEL